MKLLSLNKKIFFFISFFAFPLVSSFSEESIDIWNKENLNKKNISREKEFNNLKKIKKSNININSVSTKKIIVSANKVSLNTDSIYGIYEPNENNLTLEMWINSEGTRVKDTIDRINRIKLSSYAEDIFVKTLFTISKLPNQNMNDEEFINYKIDWLVKNKKNKMISVFLDKNTNFPNKSRIIKYLIDQNIAKANIKEACEKISLISNDTKDSYLNQFQVICLINENKKNEAQLLIDLLREQKLSNKFFDKKINYILEISSKEDKKIDDSSLLNFYLSSITISDFNYKPNKKTDIRIWEYLTAANLINIKDFENNEQIKELEVAANNNSLAKSYILEVYKSIKFSFNDLLNIDLVYPTLDPISARALVYQKILLSDNTETKLKYLFLLNDLFINDNLSNVFKVHLSQELENLDGEKIPLEYETLVSKNIIYKKINKLGKIKYSDKNYHTSKIIRYYVEKNVSRKITEKELIKVHKKLKKNRKYKFSLKDVILLESLKHDGFLLPKDINYEEISKNNLPPAELLNLVKNKEIGLALLRIVELVGEDELADLDSQTIYFISHLLKKADLTKLRNKILISVLPERTKI
ncbi:hypothetical protein OAB59_02295 [Pelagibacteraceae bacterium]|nr:hypothetical protein [Pelagibacteraceae bacterium]